MLDDLRCNLDRQSLLPDIELKSIARVSWTVMYGTKYCKNGILAVDITFEPYLLPVFGSIKEIWVIHDYIYFEVSLFKTICVENDTQAYQIEDQIPASIHICAYERFNVFHVKILKKNKFVAVKYDLNDIVKEYSQDIMIFYVHNAILVLMLKSLQYYYTFFFIRKSSFDLMLNFLNFFLTFTFSSLRII